MARNVELLKLTLAKIEANPQLWDQDHWVIETHCGTAYCFAGHAAVESGARFIGDDTVVAPGFAPRQDIQTYAAGVLGIEDTAEYDEDEDEYHIPLFDYRNTLDDLRRIVGELTGGAS